MRTHSADCATDMMRHATVLSNDGCASLSEHNEELNSLRRGNKKQELVFSRFLDKDQMRVLKSADFLKHLENTSKCVLNCLDRSGWEPGDWAAFNNFSE